ncbi:hypothetical protein OG21DRAFT_1527823 [Imleria badia]|nr:hypothetical protein OG21DRAFT_1527823 [Imleria badia]
MQSPTSQSAESDIIVLPPGNSAEAHLLLEAAHTDWEVQLTCRNLVLQIVHRNTLMLQYNHLLLDKAQEDLWTTDRFIGHVHFVIRKSSVELSSTLQAYTHISLHSTTISPTAPQSESTQFDTSPSPPEFTR